MSKGSLSSMQMEDFVDIDLVSPPVQRQAKRDRNDIEKPKNVIDLTTESSESSVRHISLKKKATVKTVDPLITARDHLKEHLVLPSYQEQGIRWMLRRNNSNNHVIGGILADDMGLGKTVQTISMIAASNPKPGDSTLIVAPFCVLTQWLSEFRKFSKFEPVIFHGGSRKLAIRQDIPNIILTTYGVILSESKKTR